MVIDQAAAWLAGSILVTLSIIIIVAGIILINHLLQKYWKPIAWMKPVYHPVYFDPQTGEQLTETTEFKKEAKNERLMGRKVSS